MTSEKDKEIEKRINKDLPAGVGEEPRKELEPKGPGQERKDEGNG